VAHQGGRPRREKKGEEQMKAYYAKVFRHILSATVLIGFGLNLSN
jgi:hypothetical protein